MTTPQKATSATNLTLSQRFLTNPDAQAPLALLALVALFFSPALSGQRTLLPLDILAATPPWRSAETPPPHNELLGDVVLQNVGWKQFIRESQRDGQLPFWNPYSLAGTPFLAEGQNGALYPLNVIFLALPLVHAYGWSAALHVLLLAWGTYAFLRALGAGPPGGLLAAIAVGFSTVVTTTFMWPMIGSTVAWLPWLLLTTERGMRSIEAGNWRAVARWGPAFAVTLGMMLLAGHLEYSGYVLAIWGWFFAWRFLGLPHPFGFAQGRPNPLPEGAGNRSAEVLRPLRGLRTTFWTVVGWGLALLAGLMLAAPLLLPFVGVARLNYRVGELRYEDIVGFALPVKQLAALLVPDLFGNPSHHTYFDLTTWRMTPILGATDAQGAARTFPFWGASNYVEQAGFIGTLPLVLAVGTMLLRRDRLVLTFASLAVVSLLLAAGTPLYRLVFALPGANQLHTPFRWLLPLSFSLAVLAGLGADALAREPTLRVWRLLARACGLGGALLLAALLLSRLLLGPMLAFADRLLASNPGLARAFSTASFLYSYQAKNLFIFAVALVASAAVLSLARRRRRIGPWPLFAPFAGLAIALELLPLGFTYQAWSDPHLLDEAPGSIRFLQDRAREEPLMRIASYGPSDALPPVTALQYGLQDIRGYDTLIMKRFTEYWSLMEPPQGLPYSKLMRLGDPASLDSPLLDLLGVRYLLTDGPLPSSRWRLVYDDEVRIYRNDGAMPRAFVVFEAVSAPGGDGALAALRASGFDPRRSVVLENAGANGRSPLHTTSTPPPLSPAQVVSHSPNRVEIEATLPTPGYLVLADVHTPQWRAEVDGAPAPVLRADAAFRAVALTEGTHRVVFRYGTTDFQVGLLLAAIAGLGVVASMAVGFWPRIATDGPAPIAMRVLKNSLTPMAAQVVNRLMDLGFAVFMLRLLGPEGAGRYAFAVVLVGYFAIFSDFGLGTLITREVARRADLAGRYVTNAVLLRWALWVVAALGLAGVLLFYRSRLSLAEDALWAALLLGLALLPQTVSSALSALFQAHERMEVPAAVGLVVNLLKIVLGVPALLAGWGIVGLGLVALVGSAVNALVFIALTRGLLGLPPWQPERSFRRDLVREATPLLANAFLASLFFRLDVLLLQALRGDQATGWYTTAYKFIDGLLLIPSLFTLAAFPLLSRWGAGDAEALRRASRRALKALLIVALPVSAGVALIADQLVLLLFGDAFAPSILALRLLIWFFPFSAVNGFLQYVLIALDQQRFLTRAFVWATAFNLAANAIAIPLFGLYGAAFVTVLSELALLAPFVWATQQHVGGLGLAGLAARPALAAAAMMAALWPLHAWPLWALAPLGAILYVAVLLVSRALDSEDWALVHSLLGRGARTRTP